MFSTFDNCQTRSHQDGQDIYKKHFPSQLE
jgi:hypothetical protein